MTGAFLWVAVARERGGLTLQGSVAEVVMPRGAGWSGTPGRVGWLLAHTQDEIHLLVVVV